jgi:two-component system, cell cycle sensor histidine kinase and response regulator CckA
VGNPEKGFWKGASMGVVEHGHPSGSAVGPSAAPPRATVLVVDDEALMRTVMKRVLLDEGFDVLTAASPAEALALAGRIGRPDLVLTDLIMPGMDGVELVGRLRELWPEVPVVFMSAATESSQVSRLAETESGAVLEKPFEIETLARCVFDTLHLPH